MSEQQAPADQAQQILAAHKFKQKLLKDAADAYQTFLNCVKPMISSPLQQTQAFIRFDEGHFWLSQSILNAPVNLELINLPKEPANDDDQPPAA